MSKLIYYIENLSQKPKLIFGISAPPEGCVDHCEGAGCRKNEARRGPSHTSSGAQGRVFKSRHDDSPFSAFNLMTMFDFL